MWEIHGERLDGYGHYGDYSEYDSKVLADLDDNMKGKGPLWLPNEFRIEMGGERQINFQLHVSLMVEHASRCQSLACLSSNCQKMKFYLKHGLACKVSGCHLCKRTTSLLRIHAQQCKIDTTARYVPGHISLQECILQLRKNMKAAASVEI